MQPLLHCNIVVTVYSFIYLFIYLFILKQTSRQQFMPLYSDMSNITILKENNNFNLIKTIVLGTGCAFKHYYGKHYGKRISEIRPCYMPVPR